MAEGVILCTGASYHMSMERVIADTVHIYRLMNLPKAAELPPEAVRRAGGLRQGARRGAGHRRPDGYHGAAPAAQRRAAAVPSGGEGSQQGAAVPPTRWISCPSREVALETEEAARTLCITVNPVSAYGWKFDKDEFLHRMREAVEVPVINVKEELA